MCEFLDAIPPTYEPLFPPALSPIYAKADLDSGFDIDIAGLTPTIHKDLVEVSTTLTPSQGAAKLTLTLNSRTQKKKNGYRP